MPYQCRDCSYKGKRFDQGICPACGSANITSKRTSEKEEGTHSPLRLCLLIGLWGWLIYLLYIKLV